MKRIILLSFMLLLFGACKTQTAVAPFVLRDSISITYKQGQVELDKEPDYNTSGDSPRCVTAPLQHTSGQSPLCNRPAITVKPRQIPQKVRVDTLIVERWHTTEVPAPPKPIPRFYKDCTWGFFILLLLILGRIALKSVILGITLTDKGARTKMHFY